MKPNFRKYTLLAILIIISWNGIKISTTSLNNPITWDGFGYYLYLPQTFINHNLAMHEKPEVEKAMKKYKPSSTFYQAHVSENGNFVIRYTPGLAIIHAPGFLIAHMYAQQNSKYEADGYSWPYQLAAYITYWLIFLMGIILCGKVLSQLFEDKISAITLLLLFFGTNLFFYLPLATLNVHGYLFTGYCWLILLTMKWHRDRKVTTALLMGICIGMMTLMRVTEIISILIPLLWPIDGKFQPIQKMKWLLSKYRKSLIAIVLPMIALISIIPLYWKKYAGHFIYNSYDNPGEGLDLLYPHTLRFLFDFRNGWFIYTPMVVLALFGLYYCYRKRKELFWVLLIFVAIDIYIVSSWTLWYYGGTFGQRATIQIMPIMGILLGFFLMLLRNQRRRIKSTIGVIIIFFVALNIFQTYQYYHGVWPENRMTGKYYFAAFFDLKPDPTKENLLHVKRGTETDDTFTDTTNYRLSKTWTMQASDVQNPAEAKRVIDGINVIESSDKFPFALTMRIPFNEITKDDHAWLRVTTKYYVDSSCNKSNNTLVTTFSHKNENYKYRTLALETSEVKDKGKWITVEKDYLTPWIRRNNDQFITYVWHISGDPIYVSEIKIESYLRK